MPAAMITAAIAVALASASPAPGTAPPATPSATGKPDAPPAWTPPRPRSASERVENREAMVRAQMAEPADGRDPVRDERVLEAMRTVPRHAFVPLEHFNRAYSDTPLPIGHGQTISQPYIVAYMTELLKLEPGAKVLEIGTGSGYQAAVLGQLTSEVYTIEIIEPLAERAANVLKSQGYDDVKTRRDDGYFGWEEHAPFDAIIVTAAAAHVPPPLWEQLKPGGRMVIPVGGVYDVQRLLALDKTEDGKRKSRSVMAVRFVPLTGGRKQ
ncbi:MAG: protein-L-isoaspartate(D-aspartate) O-methyltransferase [Planctomycetota bacterium]|jgi:protein-L-isoaspartate(D-aspartate) O-methyltransferase